MQSRPSLRHDRLELDRPPRYSGPEIGRWRKSSSDYLTLTRHWTTLDTCEIECFSLIQLIVSDDEHDAVNTGCNDVATDKTMSTSPDLRRHLVALQAYSIVDHKRKQLKYIATGGAITWFTGVLTLLRDLVLHSSGTARSVGNCSILLVCLLIRAKVLYVFIAPVWSLDHFNVLISCAITPISRDESNRAYTCHHSGRSLRFLSIKIGATRLDYEVLYPFVQIFLVTMPQWIQTLH